VLSICILGLIVLACLHRPIAPPEWTGASDSEAEARQQVEADFAALSKRHGGELSPQLVTEIGRTLEMIPEGKRIHFTLQDLYDLTMARLEQQREVAKAVASLGGPPEGETP
jgi:hypothetical protein